jgi:peroxiredoxin
VSDRTHVAESASKPADDVIPSTAGSPDTMTSILRARSRSPAGPAWMSWVRTGRRVQLTVRRHPLGATLSLARRACRIISFTDRMEALMALLHPGDKFPALTVALAGGGSLQLPDALDGHFGVVLFYRGAWCPYCNAQLRAFQRAKDQLAEVGAQVVALSVDDEAAAAELIAKHGLQFGVGYGADVRAVAEATGAFVNDDPLFLQSTGFVLNPSGQVAVGVYSTGAIGRLVPDDVIGLIRYLRARAA